MNNPIFIIDFGILKPSKSSGIVAT